MASGTSLNRYRLSMTGVTFPASSSSRMRLRSSLTDLAMNMTNFWLTNRDNGRLTVRPYRHRITLACRPSGNHLPQRCIRGLLLRPTTRDHEVDANTEGYYGEIHFKTGFGRGLCGALRRHRRCAGSAECYRLVGQQLQRERQPIQPTRSDHGGQCRHASAGVAVSSQACRLYRPAES